MPPRTSSLMIAAAALTAVPIAGAKTRPATGQRAAAGLAVAPAAADPVATVTVVTPQRSAVTPVVTQVDPTHVTVAASANQSRAATVFVPLTQLQVSAGDTVALSAPSGRTLVVSVGNSRAIIDGTVQGPTRCDVYLIAPSGVTVGPQGTIASNGSAVIATATSVRLSNGTTWNGAGDPPPANVGSASVVALVRSGPTAQGATGGTVTVDGGAIDIPITGPLAQRPGVPYVLAIVANGITLTDGTTLSAYGGRADLIGLRQGSVTRLDPHAPATAVGDPAVLGGRADVTLSGKVDVTASAFGDGYVDLGGRVAVVARNLSMVGRSDGTGGATIEAAATNVAGQGPGSVRIDATGKVTIAAGSVVDTSSHGRVGLAAPSKTDQIQVVAGSVDVDGAGYDGETGLLAGNTVGSGERVRLTATAGPVVFQSGGLVRATSYGTQNAGVIQINAPAGAVVLDGGTPATPGNITGLFAIGQGQSTAGGGEVLVNGRDVRLVHSGEILVGNDDSGAGGQVRVRASGNVIVDGSEPAGTRATRILAQSEGGAVGSGSILLQAGSELRVIHGAQVIADGNGGHVRLAAPSGLVQVSGATVTASGGPAPAGVLVNAGLFTPTAATSLGGQPPSPVTVDAVVYVPIGNVQLDGGHATVTTESSGADRLIPRRVGPTTAPAARSELPPAIQPSTGTAPGVHRPVSVPPQLSSD